MTEAAGSVADGNATPLADGVALVDQATFDEVRDRALAVDGIRAELAHRTGCDPSADWTTVVAAINDALTEVDTAAEGVEVIDTAELTALRTDAEMHRNAREYAVVDNAVRDGRLRPFERESWVAMLRDTPAAAAILAGLPVRVPVDGARGYAGSLDAVGEADTDDDLRKLFGDS